MMDQHDKWKIEQLEKRVEALEIRRDDLYERIDQLEEGLDKRLIALEKNLEGMQQIMNANSLMGTRSNRRLDALEKRPGPHTH